LIREEESEAEERQERGECRGLLPPGLKEEERQRVQMALNNTSLREGSRVQPVTDLPKRETSTCSPPRVRE